MLLCKIAILEGTVYVCELSASLYTHQVSFGDHAIAPSSPSIAHVTP